MGAAKEVGTALRVSARVAAEGRFWAEILRAIVTSPILLAVCVLFLINKLIAVTPVTVLFAAGSMAPGLLMVLLGGLLLAPLLARAWCPVAARAAARAMDLHLHEVPLPTYWVFLGWWLLFALLLVVMSVLAVFLPRPLSMLMLLPVAIVASGFHVRCALAVHADGDERRAILAATFKRRTFLWFAVCMLPLYAWARFEVLVEGPPWMRMDYAPTLLSRSIDLGMFSISTGLFILSLVVWAALSLQALAEFNTRAALFGRPARQRGAAAPAPAPQAAVKLSGATAFHPPPDMLGARPPAATSRAGWLLPLFLLLLALGAAAYLSRLALLNWYFNMSDADYAQEHSYKSQTHSTAQMLEIALKEAACRGNLPRMELIGRFGLVAQQRTLDDGLRCAAAAGHLGAAQYMIGRGADINATPRKEGGYETLPVSALQMAVERHQGPMVELLLKNGADPNLQSKEDRPGTTAGPLHLAAKGHDLALVRTLIAAGADPNAPLPRPPMFYFIEELADAPATPGSTGSAKSAQP